MSRGNTTGRNRVPQLVRLFVRPLPASAPPFWPKDGDGLRWAAVIAGGDGWAFGEPELLKPSEVRTAEDTFLMEWDDGAEFRREPVPR